MPVRIFNRSTKSGQMTAAQSGSDPAAFNSAGIATVTTPAPFLTAFAGIECPGEPGLDLVEGTAGNATITITVPTDKYWRLVGMYHTLVTDATVVNRAVVITTRTTADVTIEAITHANVAASTTVKRHTLWGTDDYVRGDAAIASQGTLTLDTKPTAADTMTLNGQAFTWVASLTAGNSNELLIGANVAASQAALEAAFKDRDNGGTLHSVSDSVYTACGMSMAAFAANDAVFTASVKGTAGDSLATTETYTAVTNVFDAATLGTTTAGVDAASKVSTLDWPTSGPYLTAGEDVYISVTNGVAGDSLDTYLFYVEFDADVS